MINLALVSSIIACIILIVFINKKSKEKDITKTLSLLFVSLIIWCSGLILQRILIVIYPGFNPIYSDYITYIGICFAPPLCFIMAKIYSETGVKDKTKVFLFIIPIISLLLLWTNDFHQLFYKVYSVNFNEAVYGPAFNINTLYSYVMIFSFMIIMLKTSVKKSGFFSIQTGLIVFGSLVPLVVNILGTLRVIVISIYITPISFVVTVICYAFSIIKFKALNVIPVAFKTVVDTMSDSFVVISDDGTIADKNRTFEKTFGEIMQLETKDNFFDIIKTTKIIDYDTFLEYLKEAQVKNKVITKEWNIKHGEIDRYFEVDIQGIKAQRGNEFVASLLLFRDITNQKRDMDIFTKNENLVILGELAGGVAHDINTPISAIKSGLLMLKDTAKNDDEKMLMSRMDSCADKIIALVNSLRNQIRNIGSDIKVPVNIATVIKDTSIIINNELVKSGVKLNMNIKDDITVIGEPTKLGQVITNLVMNAIQAYDGKPGIVDVDLHKSENNEAVITVEDYAGGIAEDIKPYIFKNILTTKGVSGTGFGLYLAYSVIKGAFGGEITFTSMVGKGTKFNIVIPLDVEI